MLSEVSCFILYARIIPGKKNILLRDKEDLLLPFLIQQPRKHEKRLSNNADTPSHKATPARLQKRRAENPSLLSSPRRKPAPEAQPLPGAAACSHSAAPCSHPQGPKQSHEVSVTRSPASCQHYFSRSIIYFSRSAPLRGSTDAAMAQRGGAAGRFKGRR